MSTIHGRTAASPSNVGHDILMITSSRSAYGNGYTCYRDYHDNGSLLFNFRSSYSLVALLLLVADVTRMSKSNLEIRLSRSSTTLDCNISVPQPVRDLEPNKEANDDPFVVTFDDADPANPKVGLS